MAIKKSSAPTIIDVAELAGVSRVELKGGKAASPASMKRISDDDIRSAVDRLQPGVLGAPLGIATLLKSSGLAPSTSEANRLIDGGGVRIDSSVVSDKGLKLGAGVYVVQVGKRKFARVTLS